MFAKATICLIVTYNYVNYTSAVWDNLYIGISKKSPLRLTEYSPVKCRAMNKVPDYSQPVV